MTEDLTWETENMELLLTEVGKSGRRRSRFNNLGAGVKSE